MSVSLGTICEALPIALLAVSVGDGQILDLNYEAETLLGTSRTRARRSRLQRFFDSPDAVEEALRTLERTRNRVQLRQHMRVRISQDLVPVRIDLSPYAHEHADENLALVHIQLLNQQAEALPNEVDQQFLSRLLAEIAHEVRNPLSAILGATSLLTEAPELGDQTRSLLQVVSDEGHRLQQMIDRIQEFANPASLECRPVNIHRLLTAVVETLRPQAERRQIALRELYDPSIPEFPADADRLMRVFHNLLKNAIEASQSNDRVHVRTATELRETSPGRLSVWVRIQFEDRGMGMTPEVREHLFVPFFTTKADGTGLGLAISRKIVEAHQGQLQIDSTVGIGTRVSISLPLKARNQCHE